MKRARKTRRKLEKNREEAGAGGIKAHAVHKGRCKGDKRHEGRYKGDITVIRDIKGGIREM